MQNIKAVTNYANKVINSIYSASKPLVYPYSYRVSGLPSCPIMTALGKPLGKPDKKDYSFGFYTSIGTSIHQNLQELAVHSDICQDIIGCWRCKCGVRPIQRFPGKCKRCQQIPDYEEVTYNYGGATIHLSGHSDFITSTRINNKSVNILWDFKTTKAKNIANKNHDNKKYHIQCQAYTYLLWKLFKIKVDYYIICYISRDECGKPVINLRDLLKGQQAVQGAPLHTKISIFPIRSDTIKYVSMQMQRGLRGHKLLLQWFQRNGLWQQDRSQLIPGLIAARPCQNYADWQYYTSRAFFHERCQFLCDKGCHIAKARQALTELT